TDYNTNIFELTLNDRLEISCHACQMRHDKRSRGVSPLVKFLLNKSLLHTLTNFPSPIQFHASWQSWSLLLDDENSADPKASIIASNAPTVASVARDRPSAIVA